VDKCLESHKWPKLTQVEIKNLNWPVTKKEVELIIIIKKNLPIKKSPDPDGFIGEFFHKFTVKSTLILIELHKVEEEADFSLCVSAIALTSKSEKNDNKNADH
jgi:hypothetical protein